MFSYFKYFGLFILLITSIICCENENKHNEQAEEKNKAIKLFFGDNQKSCMLLLNKENVIIEYESNEEIGTIKNGIISNDLRSNSYRIANGDDGEGLVIEIYDSNGNFKEVLCFNQNESDISFNQLATFIKTGSFESYKEIKGDTPHNEETKASLAEIRSKIIYGDKYNLFHRFGKPDESYSSADFLEKYYNWKRHSVYETNVLLNSVVFIYNNLSDKPIIVIYDSEKAKVFEVIYKNEIKSIEDISVSRERWKRFYRH